MIYDCFTYNLEQKMLEFRVMELKKVVDVFVVVESDKTFSGLNKPIDKEYLELLAQKHDVKFLHHIVNDMPQADAWTCERHQRDSIGVAISQLAPYPTDWMLVSDCDEIPDPRAIESITKNHNSGIFTLEQDLYYYHLECKALGTWCKAKLLDVQTFFDIGSAETVRHYSAQHVPKGGWHLSYFGDADFIRNKLESFSHQEYNHERYKSADNVMDCITNCKDLFHRGDGFRRVKVVDNQYLPVNFKVLVD